MCLCSTWTRTGRNSWMSKSMHMLDSHLCTCVLAQNECVQVLCISAFDAFIGVGVRKRLAVKQTLMCCSCMFQCCNVCCCTFTAFTTRIVRLIVETPRSYQQCWRDSLEQTHQNAECHFADIVTILASECGIDKTHKHIQRILTKALDTLLNSCEI
jgi:hypothetical protein